MASFNLTVNYPDGEGARILTALKTHWTTVDANGNPVVPTNAQVVQKLSESVAKNIIAITRRVEQDTAVAAAIAGVTDINATP